MSDFPELEEFSNIPASTDPQADFLARERALLGDEFGGIPTDFENHHDPHSDQFGLDGFDSAGPPQSNQLPTSSTQPPISAAGIKDELASFQDQYPDLSQDIAPPSQTNGFNAPAPSLYANQSPTYTSATVYAQTQQEEESSFIREWRVKQAEEIQIRDQRSLAKREETIAAAEKAIDEFYNSYNTQKEKNIAKNKEQEAKFLQTRNDKLGQGTIWERIAELIELQDSRSKTCGKSARDLSRFKEILLSLKREGENAPGAAGY